MISRLAIEKAIEGGYERYALKKGYEIKSYVTSSMPNNYFVELYDGSDIHIAAIALDPSFWQCLGKALGWPDDWGIHEYRLSDEVEGTLRRRNSPKFHAHEFYDLILTGGDTDAFWRKVLKQECPSYVKGGEVYDCNCGECF